jgi:hypothetical protein
MRSEQWDTASLGERSNKNVVVLWVALVRLDASVDRSRYG